MSSFTSKLVLSPINSRFWQLEKEFEYKVGDIDSSEIIKVPAGFITDFASVPKIFWSVLPPWGTYVKAAIIHDFLYKRQIYSRKKTDQLFLEGMKILKVSNSTRLTMYLAVRIFGNSTWNKYSVELKRSN